MTVTHGLRKISKGNCPHYRRRWLFWFPPRLCSEPERIPCDSVRHQQPCSFYSRRNQVYPWRHSPPL
ncbi:hypothetical protein GH733_012902 [Mirounga leonina]|nr:hypothetical protein GH733_012902 [Mirounga leonina]